MMDEKKMNQLNDDDLELVNGGIIKKYAADRYEVIDDKTQSVVATFNNKADAVNYAKEHKLRSNVLAVKTKKKK